MKKSFDQKIFSFDQKIFGFDQNFKKNFGFGFDQNYLKVRVFDQLCVQLEQKASFASLVVQYTIVCTET